MDSFTQSISFVFHDAYQSDILKYIKIVFLLIESIFLFLLIGRNFYPFRLLI